MHPCYSPHGLWTTPTGTVISRVMRTRRQVSTQTLHSEVEDIHAQLTATTVPLTTRVEQTSQSVQQAAAAVGQALECTSAAQAQTKELCAEVEGALRQQAVTA